MKEIVIVGGVRTPQGVLGGALKDLTAADLGEHVTKELLKRTRVDPGLVSEVIFGCVGQTSDAPNVARVIALRSGIPKEKGAYTVQRNCASGMEAIVSACRAIQSGEGEVYLAGGTESMSQAPYVSRDMRFGKHLRHAQFTDALWEGLTDPVCGQVMGETAENLVEEFKISRQEQDQFAVLSHKKAFKATREGKFKEEIAPITVRKKRSGKEVAQETISEDEGPNAGLTEQTLSQYPVIFRQNGTVTAGNSCPLNDGASCVLVMTAERAKALGMAPLGMVRSYAFVGLEPQRMGLGPACAVPVALQKISLQLKDIDLIEINEAFAAQVLACQRQLNWNPEIVNVNGGAIAIGHPVGATGCRIVITLLYEMKRRNLKRGLATLCVGGGQGGAMVLEKP